MSSYIHGLGRNSRAQNIGNHLTGIGSSSQEELAIGEDREQACSDNSTLWWELLFSRARQMDKRGVLSVYLLDEVDQCLLGYFTLMSGLSQLRQLD